MAEEAPRLVLASRSSARSLLLRRAGIAFDVDAASLDEEAVKLAMKAEGATAMDAAATLAALKAERVCARHPGVLVVGADQILDCGDQWFDKPTDAAHLRAHLTALRGREHRLETAVCVARDGAVIWHDGDSATLTMRPFSDQFLDGYLVAAGPEALESVGGYRLEGSGAQLFSRIDGDFFTILGLPLLPLLAFLRGHGIGVE
jgi:septum formation protein